MAKSDRTKALEFSADALARFERAVDVVAKSPPQHRTKSAKSRESKRKKALAGPISHPTRVKG